jgi:hypothetical protein
MRPRGSVMSEPTIHVQTLPCGLRVGMFADNGPLKRTGRKPGALAPRSRRMRVGMQLLGGAALFVTGTAFGLNINTVLPRASPGSQLHALAQPGLGTPQVLADAPSDQRSAGSARPLSITEPASYHALGTKTGELDWTSASSPASAAPIPIPGPAFESQRPVSAAQNQDLTSTRKLLAGKFAAHAERAHRHQHRVLDSSSSRAGFRSINVPSDAAAIPFPRMWKVMAQASTL